MSYKRQVQSFEFPMGLQVPERCNFRQREGYEAAYLVDDEIPRYRYSLVLSADRIQQAVERAFELLPDQLHIILEESKFNHEAPHHVEVWTGPDLPRSVLRQVWEGHKQLFVHDAMVGFGAANFDRGLEIFLDCHKVFYIYSVDMEIPERIVHDLELRYYKRLTHISDLGYDAVSLTELGEGEDYREVLEELRTELDLDLAEVRE